MRFLSKLVSALVMLLTAFSCEAAHTKARLVLGAEEAQPGDTVMAGVRLEMESGWHTYWQNPGASGIPTKIEWELPRGITAGETEWPVPQKLPDEELTTYVYENEVLLLTPLHVNSDLAPGNMKLRAKVSWLECKVQCIPGDEEVEATLTVGKELKVSSTASELENWQKKLPVAAKALKASAEWEKSTVRDLRPLVLEWSTTNRVGLADFFPYANENFEVQGPTERLESTDLRPDTVRIRKQVKKIAGDWPKEISGLLVEGTGTKRSAYFVSLAPLGQERTGAMEALTNSGPAAVIRPPSIWKVLFSAMLGGIILNIMPCVLPVIALKILGFVAQAKEEPRQVRKLGLVYGLGILVSFLVLALVVLAVQAAGKKAGWGLQFSNPYFLVVMTVLITLIALNLFGVFEVQLGGGAMDAAARLSSRHGAAGAFFNGLLATVLATSCTAPFLSAAVGFAFGPGQSAFLSVLIFLTIGFGLALPYVMLCFQPGWLKFLPKPGRWMEQFKIAMGFPMLAAAVWLFNLTSLYYGERSWWLAVFLVLLAAVAWLYGEFAQRSRSRRGLALTAVMGLLLASYILVLDGQLKWREPNDLTKTNLSSERKPGGVPWEPWTPAAVAQGRVEKRLVLVDFTAKWCLTCNTIIKPALESSTVRKKLAELNALPLLADYTARPDAMTDELIRHGRAGVPLVLIYPADASRPPLILPEALTPGMVVDALNQAAK